jgi:NAD(P)-dependent dehydrogenase (short-subunit alcohol dehydrogenase family)
LAPTSIRTAANVAAMGTDSRYVEREELAAMVLLLCSPAFGRVTGQVIELA